jgi:hypothetical protein
MVRRFSKSMGVVLGLLALSVVSVPAEGADVPTMNKEELRSKLGDPGVVVVDVRRDRDWKASDVKITGAVRGDPADIGSWADKHPRDKTLVLYCA